MRDSEKRLSSVSFTRHGSVRAGAGEEEEELHMCMAPHVQALLARDQRRPSCCGLAVPVPFERAAPNNFFNPKFDSDILEGQYKSSSFPQIRLRFRYALLYIMVFSLAWISYFLAFGLNGLAVNWLILCTVFTGLFLLTLIILLVTFTDFYRTHMFGISVIIAFILCALSLSLIGLFPYRTLKDVKLIGDISRDVNFIGDFSQAGHFVMCVEVILIIYTVIPLPLYLCVGLSLSYSTIFEAMNIYIHTKDNTLSYSGLVVRGLLQICVHIIGFHILLMTVVRMRGTFMKVGQSLLVRKQLEMEKLLKEKMIHSVMPPKVADWLMSETGMESENSLKRTNSLHPRNSNPGASDLKSLFRPFNMHCMENVSILFADIVGFTKMSSNKTAEELVTILNDLFERFDDLCSLNNCEKISTLGDCYYCVSGCPEPRPDHAKCCVEMGLGMITAIKYFDEQRGEGVSMRVGVHTGKVLCGIVGTRRFKFDVWSNDVTLANRMESTGKPGRVHVSEETARFLTDYILEEGDDVFGHKTYFIEGRQPQVSIDGNLSRCNTIHTSMPLKLIISPPKTSDSLSPVMNSLSPCVNVSLAPDDIPGQLGLSASLTPPVINPNRLSPNPFHLKMKASSLPSILDMENEEDKTKVVKQLSDESSKSPTSTGSYGKYTSKIKSWKVPKFLRKTDASNDSVKIEELSKSTCEKENSSGDHSVPSSNGYQQVPIVIETVETNLLKPSDANRTDRLIIEPYGQRFSNASVYENDILDIKSYISQSRSDVSPFARSSSYRSQYGRTSHCELAQVGRARSSTMSQLHDLPIIALNPRPLNTEDQISLCPSVNSRKDSGIRSTSRRSSIQQQIYMVSQSALGASQDLQRRVSGYYTSSQSSLARPSLNLNSAYQQACHQKLRKQSDLQLIRCVQDNAKSRFSYFVKPPLSPITLFFKSADMENEYRNTAHRINEKEVECPPTLATSRFNTYLDVVISAVIFLIVSASLFVLYEPGWIWIGLFAVFVLFQLLAIALCIHRHRVLSQSFLSKSNEYDEVAKPLEDLLYRLSDWYPWHLFGGVFLSLPVISVLVNFSCDNSAVKITSSDQSHYIYLLCISIVHFCNFTQINLWVKNCLLTVSAIVFISVAVLYCPAAATSAGACGRFRPSSDINEPFDPSAAVSSLHADRLPLVQEKPPANNITNLSYPGGTPLTAGQTKSNTSKNNEIVKENAAGLRDRLVNSNNTSPAPVFAKSTSQRPPGSSTINHSSDCMYTGEIYLDILLLIILVWFLNREFEISYRMSFYGNIVANKDKVRVQSMRNQADWLLHNIIPRHVAEQLKNTAKYSENHKNVGILFASIVNFNEMYDESYLGGKEYLRVLNELIGDFDELLEHPRFRAVDKIKTIGSTFMAASGLNPQMRQETPDPHAHLYSLMDFAIAMQKVIYDFNQDLLEFNLILRVGYNFGDVTAGVIGTTKLYYDIWGDAVNIASRMDSTGVNGKIQIGEACLGVLDNAYEFEPRGSVYVKGKDNMNVFLLSRKRTVENADAL